MKNTNESAKVVPSSTCVLIPAAATYGYNMMDRSQLPAGYLATLGAAAAVSYLPFTATGGAGPAAGAAATHLAMPLPAGATPLIAADYSCAAAGSNGGGVEPGYSYSNTSSFTVAATSPCLPMFFSSETSFQLSTSPCPSDANLTASQVAIVAY